MNRCGYGLKNLTQYSPSDYLSNGTNRKSLSITVFFKLIFKNYENQKIENLCNIKNYCGPTVAVTDLKI